MSVPDLFCPYPLSDRLTLKNRIVMGPLMRLTLCENGMPAQDLAQYYSDRADAGLLITEVVMISPQARGYANNLGIYSDSQITRWKEITDAVHRRDGKIFIQLWHPGRVSHPNFLNGAQPVAPSAVPLTGEVPWADNLRYGMPRALQVPEIKAIVQHFSRAAANAMQAGFDGVELHGGNGYLIDEFLHQETNLREDEYGGNPANKARFVLEVIDSLSQNIDPGSIGIRLAPAAYLNMTPRPEDPITFMHLLKELEKRRLAYIHESIDDDSRSFDYLNGRVSEFLRRNYRGTIIGNGGFTPELARRAIKNGNCDLVSFGRLFATYPDLVERIRTNQPTH